MFRFGRLLWQGILLTAIPLAGQTLSPSEAQCPSSDEVSGWFTAIHARAWSAVTPDALALIAGSARIKALDERTACSSTEEQPPCAALVVSTNRSNSATCFVWAVFEQELQSEECSTKLQSFTFRADLPLSGAMHLVTEVQRSLKAGGKPVGDQWDETYVWRSRDSKIVFELVTQLKVPDTRLTPSTTVNVMVRLRHSVADTADVDELPFERGVFLAQPCVP